jgi:hypothetical protein
MYIGKGMLRNSVYSLKNQMKIEELERKSTVNLARRFQRLSLVL